MDAGLPLFLAGPSGAGLVSFAIEVVGLTKAYGAGLRDLVWSGDRPARLGWRALADVSLRVERGSALGVVGRNGAGKSTLLRILAGTARPTSGASRVRGRTGTLLDLGAGFIEDWSGVENARGALALGGCTPTETEERLDFVRRFAELGDFLEQPIRVYSAGMRLRLAYALAITGDPEVLITDEVLVVGDEAFQRKSSQHILDYLARGGTLVLATHNLYLAERLCQQALWLDRGHTLAQGPCREVTKAYRDWLAASARSDRSRLGPAVQTDSRGIRAGSLRVQSSGSAAAPSQSEGTAPIHFDDAFEVRIPRCAEGASVAFVIERADGALVAKHPVGPTGGTLRVPGGVLLPGRYRLCLVDVSSERERVLHEVWMESRGERRELGSVLLPHHWRAVRGRSKGSA